VERPDDQSRTGECRRRVLLVDDSPDILEAYSMLLETRGYEVRTAADGASALLSAREFLPHVVLLDVRLHAEHGVDVLARLREVPGLQDTSFVAFSGETSLDDRVRALESGFDRYLTKPATADDILCVLE
jgi:DNA-binding response OmpR family regulator